MEQASDELTLKSFSRNGLGLLIAVLTMMSMMVLPMPPIMLDMLFTFNISLALVVLLAGIYTSRPLDLAVFPTILLIATLLRLALNVASTRVVLLNGHTGTDAAGKVIESFGDFVVGGNYTVGLVVFVILVTINFVVVTKGAGRISEVSARFTLDAMPGKQMAIDADLNAGILSQEEARERRAEVTQEADFYGAMDGASKFVRGDAIAGIIITLINIIGGLAIGTLQHDMAFAESVNNYVLLTIGDGLVAQIPSLLLSTSAAIMVTRMSSAQDMSDAIIGQLFANPRVLTITAGIVGIIGLIPGMPNFAFLTLASIAGGGAYMMARRQREVSEVQRLAAEAPAKETAAPEKLEEITWDDVNPVDLIGLEVGYRLIPLVDRAQGGQLMGRIKGVRKKLTTELGFLIPAVHIRDNLDLSPTTYRISLMGVGVGEAEIHPDKDLAINPGQVYGELDGIPGKDPAFGLDAVWIESSLKDHAQSLGYTVVDSSTVIATHLSQILQTHAHELLGREEAQQLLDNLARTHEKLVEGLVPDILPLGVVVSVFQSLLQERIPIRDIRSIVETLAANGPASQDPAVLTAAVRLSLSRMIVQEINGLDPELPVITLDPALEQILQDSLQVTGEGAAALEPGLAERLQLALQENAQHQETIGQPAVLLVSPLLRLTLSRFARNVASNMSVLAYNEIPDNKQIKIVGSIGQ
ncbi:MAG: flagellar biosynthesis protein FlhA [Gammaproteobacteria bacterium]|nr:MAG: flagellar biosynthesis protein FlhA [Gammaproteobacteria bacterium]